MANLEKNSPSKFPPSSSNPQKVAEQPGVNGKEAEVTKGWPLMPPSPRLLPRILLKIRRRLGWRLFLQLFRYLPKVTLKAQAKDPRRLQSHNPRPRLMEKFNKKEVEFNTILFFFFSFLATSVLVFIICNQVAPLILHFY